MSFLLTEYDEAYREFLYVTVNELARCQHPILEEIATERTEGTVSSVVDSRENEQLEISSNPIGFEIRWDREEILKGNPDSLLLQLDSEGKKLGEKAVGRLIETLSAVTASTGNVIDAGGEKLSFELIIELLGKMEFSLDEDDEIVMPGILIHPDTAKGLPSEMSLQQEEVLAELKSRKREEILAKRRSRRLS